MEELRLSNGPMKPYCNKKATINIAHNPVQHDRIKHIEIVRGFIKEKLKEGTTCMLFVTSSKQLTDVFIKGVFSKCLFFFFLLFCKQVRHIGTISGEKGFLYR